MNFGATKPLSIPHKRSRKSFKKVFFCFFFSPQEKKKINCEKPAPLMKADFFYKKY